MDNYKDALDAEKTIGDIFSDFNNFIFATTNVDNLSIEEKKLLLGINEDELVSLEGDKLDKIKNAVVSLITKMIDWIKTKLSKVTGSFKSINKDRFNNFFKKYKNEKDIEKLKKDDISLEDSGRLRAFDLLLEASNTLKFIGALGEANASYTLPSVDEVLKGGGEVIVGYDNKYVYYLNKDDSYKEETKEIDGFKESGTFWLSMLEDMIEDTVENDYMKSLNDLRGSLRNVYDDGILKETNNKIKAMHRILATYSKLIRIALRVDKAIEALEQKNN